MKTAKPLPELLAVNYYHFRGSEYLEASCKDADKYTELPDAVEFEGRVFGKTGWNSDVGFAYYKPGQTFATIVPRKP